jgi:uncharacterized protein YbcV (DUF1398 family)
MDEQGNREAGGGISAGDGDLPEGGGFPYLAETLWQAGVTRNIWSLPAGQSMYLTELGPVVMMGAPVASGTVEVPRFDREALIAAVRTDQAGNSTFPEFLASSWWGGCAARWVTRRAFRYDVDFDARSVAYYGCNGEAYIEAYPAVDLKPLRERSSSQERNQCLHGLLRPLFHEPMPGIFQVDRSDIGCHKLHLRDEDCGAGFFAGD